MLSGFKMWIFIFFSYSGFIYFGLYSNFWAVLSLASVSFVYGMYWNAALPSVSKVKFDPKWFLKAMSGATLAFCGVGLFFYMFIWFSYESFFSFLGLVGLLGLFKLFILIKYGSGSDFTFLKKPITSGVASKKSLSKKSLSKKSLSKKSLSKKSLSNKSFSKKSSSKKPSSKG